MNLQTQRMQWRCRRGLLELDIVLQRFVSRCYEHLNADQLRVFDGLLDYTDNELLDLVIDRTQSPNHATQELLRMMRSHTTDSATSKATI